MLRPDDGTVSVVSLAPYSFLPALNGGQRNIALFYKYLGKNVNVTCYSVKGINSSFAENYKVVGFFSRSRLRYINPFYFFLLHRQLKNRGATHLLIEHPYLGWLAVVLKKICPVKLIVHSHNIEGLRFRDLKKWWWKLLWHYEKFVHQNSDYNLFITEEDLNYAISYFRLHPQKCMVATYGTERVEPPSAVEKEHAKFFLRNKYNLSNEDKILLFVGSFDYQPNKDAFTVIREHLSPALKKEGLAYKILICGPHLSRDESSDPNIIITGFVDDIGVYFKGSDVFINPVTDGGGIKTKLVEALGYNMNAVSTKNGAFGVSPKICNGKLFISENGQWEDFMSNLKNCFLVKQEITDEFYQHFFWGTIAQKTVKFIKGHA